MSAEGQNAASTKPMAALREALINLKVFASIAQSSLSPIGNRALASNIIQLENAIAEVLALPTAERAASDIAQAIWENDDFQNGLEMIRDNIKEEQFSAYIKIIQAIKSEINAQEKAREKA
jgi:hypothetical protein